MSWEFLVSAFDVILSPGATGVRDLTRAERVDAVDRDVFAACSGYDPVGCIV